MDRDEVVTSLREPGFLVLAAQDMRAQLDAYGELRGWDAFTASWDDLHLDRHMADGGRYRRRRHARYAVRDGVIARSAHGPHYQSVAYNPLHGGIDRWFEPITDEIGASPSMTTVLAWCRDVFEAASAIRAWNVEVHQFRIEARSGESAQPTPEGVHRDGVDYVLVLLVRRVNIASGTTTIYRPGGELLGSFTLAAPFDATVLDDTRVAHGVTPVEPVDPAQPAHRDVLVVTFVRA